MTLFTNKFLFIQPNFRMTYFVTAQTAFHHCTFRVITAHFVHHCTLKQALLSYITIVQLYLEIAHLIKLAGCIKCQLIFDYVRLTLSLSLGLRIKSNPTCICVLLCDLSVDILFRTVLLMEPFDVHNPHMTITLKITDFDAVKEHDHTTTLSFVGTCAYMAPEVLVDQRFSKASDVWR